jgi:maltokinase
MPTPDDPEVTGQAFVVALEATPPASLLPDRSQARAASLVGDVTVLDVLDLGPDAFGHPAAVAVVRVDSRDLIAPGFLDSGEFRRDPSVASLLRAGAHGAFEVELMGDGIPAGGATGLDVDQSNDSVLLGDVMVKWQLDAAPSPAPDRLRALTGSDTVPAVRAIVTWRRADGTRCAILTAADALPDASDGWTWAVELVRSHARGEEVDAITPFARIGTMAGRMHVALASAGVSTWDAADIARVQSGCLANLAEATNAVGGAEGDRLRARHSRLREVFDGLQSINTTPVIDIHGDLHIGQVLSSPLPDGGTRLAFVDFDGSPVLPPEERSARQPAARDVAGMLASIDHVARVVNHRTPGLDPEPARAWIPIAQGAFIDAYQAVLSDAGLSKLLDERLLEAMVVDQELREYLYAVRFLPHWTYVPDAVLTDLFPDDVARES